MYHNHVENDEQGFISVFFYYTLCIMCDSFFSIEYIKPIEECGTLCIFTC